MTDKTKQCFVAFFEWADSIADLPDEIQAKFFRCIFHYAKTGEIKEPLNAMEMIAWKLIQSSIDRQQAKYERTCERRREAGRLGGAPKGNQNASKQNNQKQAKQPNDCINNQKQAKQAFQNENENENENEIIVIESNKLSSTTTTTINNNIDLSSLSSSLISQNINRGDFHKMYDVLAETANNNFKGDGVKRDLSKLMLGLQKYEVDSWKDVVNIVVASNFGDKNNAVFDALRSLARRKTLPESINQYLLKVAKSKE